jgi:hypothetical protein
MKNLQGFGRFLPGNIKKKLIPGGVIKSWLTRISHHEIELKAAGGDETIKPIKRSDQLIAGSQKPAIRRRVHDSAFTTSRYPVLHA